MRVKGRLQDTGRKKIGVVMGDNAQTGINVSILPGVRIGSGSWIGPGAIISKDVPSGKLLVAKQTYVTKRLRKTGTAIERTARNAGRPKPIKSSF
jgi:bifunctional UDP-N-acetylglucosamine pyrophosphorylase/glucosamine-1-phosphate N-acetyltransferase